MEIARHIAVGLAMTAAGLHVQCTTRPLHVHLP
jgi:hypothetical protein